MKKKIGLSKEKLKALALKLLSKKRKRGIRAEVRFPDGNWLPCRAKLIETDKLEVKRFGKLIGVFDFNEVYVEYRKKKPTVMLDISNTKPYNYRLARQYQKFADEKGGVILETGINPYQPYLQKEFGFQYITSKFLRLPKIASSVIFILLIFLIVMFAYQVYHGGQVERRIGAIEEVIIEKTTPTAATCCQPCIDSWMQLFQTLRGVCESCQVPTG